MILIAYNNQQKFFKTGLGNEIQKLKNENNEIAQTVRYLGGSLTQLERKVNTGPEPPNRFFKRPRPSPSPIPSQSQSQDIRTFLAAKMEDG